MSVTAVSGVGAHGGLFPRGIATALPISEEYRRHLLAVPQLAEQYRVLVVRDQDDGALLGAVAVQRPRADGRPRTEIGFRMLAVHPRARGLGLGRALVEAAFDQARAEGVGVIAIYSGPQMVEAHSLYRSLGFVRRPEREAVVVDGGQRLRCFTVPVPDR